MSLLSDPSFLIGQLSRAYDTLVPLQLSPLPSTALPSSYYSPPPLQPSPPLRGRLDWGRHAFHRAPAAALPPVVIHSPRDSIRPPLDLRDEDDSPPPTPMTDTVPQLSVSTSAEDLVNSLDTEELPILADMGAEDSLGVDSIAESMQEVLSPVLTTNGSSISFHKLPVPPPSTQSGLALLLSSLSASPVSTNPLAPLYSLLARPAPAPLSFALFFPHSTTPSTPYTVGVRKDVSVEEVIGLGLWTFVESGGEPPLEIEQGGESVESAKWNLRIVEDDQGEVDQDFPALDRTRQISAFSFPAYAIVQATPAQVKENLVKQAKIVRRASRVLAQPAAGAGVVVAQPQNGPVGIELGMDGQGETVAQNAAPFQRPTPQTQEQTVWSFKVNRKLPLLLHNRHPRLLTLNFIERTLVISSHHPPPALPALPDFSVRPDQQSFMPSGDEPTNSSSKVEGGKTKVFTPEAVERVRETERGGGFRLWVGREAKGGKRYEFECVNRGEVKEIVSLLERFMRS